MSSSSSSTLSCEYIWSKKNPVKSSTIRRAELVSDIQSSGFEMAPCSGCRNAVVKPGEPRPKCMVSPRSKKCSECIRKNCKECDVSLSSSQWSRLRDARDKLRKDIEGLEEEEIEILQRLSRDQQALADRRMKKIRLRKQLRLAENRADNAVEEELEELESLDPPKEDTDAIEVSEHPFQFHDILEMPISSWASFSDVDFSDFPIDPSLLPLVS